MEKEFLGLLPPTLRKLVTRQVISHKQALDSFIDGSLRMKSGYDIKRARAASLLWEAR